MKNDMKTLLTSAFLVLITAFSASAQDEKSPFFVREKSKINAVGFRSQFILSDISGLTHESIINMAKNPKQVSYDMSTYEMSNDYWMEDLNVGVFVRMNHGRIGNLKTEMEVGLDYYVHSEIYVDYTDPNSADLPYIAWCLMQDRFNLQTTYWLVTNRDKKWNFRFGPSVAGGKSLNERVLIFDDEYSFTPIETIKARSSSFLHASLNAEAYKLIFNTLNLGFGIQYGKGVQLHENNTFTAFGISTSLSYKFR
jgi:hypothetical protein